MAVTINIPSQVKTYANLAAFPVSGSLKTIYIAEDTNKTYRWTGSVYVEISASAAMTWGQIGGTLSNQTDLQNALDAKVPTARTLTINGVTQDLSADRTFTIATGLTVGTTPIASGTIGRVLFQGTGNVLQQSSSLFWDGTNNRLGIGTETPSYNLDVVSASSPNFRIARTGATEIRIGASTLAGGGIIGTYSASTLNFLTNGTESFRIFTTQNIGINTTTDAGFRLDVNGTARVATNLFFDRSYATTFYGFNGNSRVYIGAPATNVLALYTDDAERMRISPTGNVGIGTTTPLVSLDIRTSNNSTITPLSSVPNDSTTLLVGNTGTNGILALGQNNTGQAWLQGRSRLGNGTSQPILLNPLGGNILIGTTTDAGYKLDVNGTARVQGNSFEVTNGTNKIAITSTQISCLAGVSVSDLNIVAGPISAPNSILGIGTTVSGGSTTILRLGAGNATNASGIVTIIESLRGFAPTSGTATFSFATWNGTINQTGGANGITRGLYINPTLTSAADFRAIETTAGRVVFGNLPTSSAGLPTGAIWNDGGTLKIV